LIPLVAIVAGAFGAVARYTAGGWTQRRSGARFPSGTAAVNLAGALGLGLAAGALDPNSLAYALAAGFCGGFTTFSTWMVETLALGRRPSERLLAIANFTLLFVLGVAAAALGYRVAS
jgi:CrcB protein